MILKERVQDYQQKKQEIQANMIKQDIPAVKPRPSSADLLQLHENNLKLIENRRQKQREKEEEEIQRQKILERIKAKVTVHAEKDPKRLLKPTANMEAKRKEASDHHETIQKQFNVNFIPIRSVPMWRQGV
jgi:hypothetical protein